MTTGPTPWPGHVFSTRVASPGRNSDEFPRHYGTTKEVSVPHNAVCQLWLQSRLTNETEHIQVAAAVTVGTGQHQCWLINGELGGFVTQELELGFEHRVGLNSEEKAFVEAGEQHGRKRGR